MKTLRAIFLFYIQSSIHVALAVVALAGVSIYHLDLSANPYLLGFIFLGAIAGYNFVKYAGVDNLHHLNRTRNVQLIRHFTVLCVFGLMYSAFHLPFNVLLVSGFFGLLTLLYALPVFKTTNLRSLKGTKVFIIATVWAGTTVVVPLVEAQQFSYDAAIEFFQRILFVIALMLPFEIRDLKYDAEELSTLPQIFGISKARKMGYLILTVMILIEFLQSNTEIHFIVITSCMAIITGLFIYRSKINQSEYYASFWVEGIPILWWAILGAVELIS